MSLSSTSYPIIKIRQSKDRNILMGTYNVENSKQFQLPTMEFENVHIMNKMMGPSGEKTSPSVLEFRRLSPDSTDQSRVMYI